MVGEGYTTAEQILSENRETLIKIAQSLIEREVLDASEIKLLRRRLGVAGASGTTGKTG